MAAKNLREMYLQRKLPRLREKLLVIERRILEAAKDEKSHFENATSFINKALGSFGSIKAFDSLENARKLFSSKLSQASSKKNRLEFAKTIVKGLMVVDILNNGFDNRFLKTLEEANISLEEPSKMDKTLINYHEDEQEGEEDDLEEMTIDPDELIKNIKDLFKPSEEYQPLLDLDPSDQIFSYEQFLSELETATIKDLGELRKLVLFNKDKFRSINLKDITSKQTQSSENKEFLNFITNLIRASKGEYGDAKKLMKGVLVDDLNIIKSFYERIKNDRGKIYKSKSVEEGIKIVLQLYKKKSLDDIKSITAIPPEGIKKLVGLMRKSSTIS